MNVKRNTLRKFTLGKCTICGHTGTTDVHHIVPISLGGPDTINNMIELCIDCHDKAHHQSSYLNLRLRGIERAKAEGKYKGRQPSIDREEFIRLKNEGYSTDDIAQEMQIGRASAYRIAKEVKGDLNG